MTPPNIVRLAQLVERRLDKAWVAGSSPAVDTMLNTPTYGVNMKLQDLFEDKDKNMGAAEKKLQDLMNDLASYLEDHQTSYIMDFGTQDVSNKRASHKNEGEPEGLAFSGGFDIQTYIEDGQRVPTAEGSLVLDVPTGHPGLHKLMKSMMSKFFESQNIRLTWSTSSPWQFKNSARDTAKFTLMKFEPTGPAPEATSSARYDPRAAFDARPGEAARQARVRASAYSDSYGGDSSNYRK